MDGGACGLTMKEYDEQLKSLTAENFNLKLKIFFMDQKLSKMQGLQDKDFFKENIDLKVHNYIFLDQGKKEWPVLYASIFLVSNFYLFTKSRFHWVNWYYTLKKALATFSIDPISKKSYNRYQINY